MGAGTISRQIPFFRRAAVRSLRTDYPTRLAALAGIEKAMREGIEANKQGIDEAALRQAIGVTQAIYRSNIFPSWCPASHH
jgi:hypothetical protein